MKKDIYFDAEKQQQAIKWLEKKWPKEKRTCEICGNSNWSISEDLVMPLPFVGGGLTVGGNAYPHILITCINCGNAKFLNAVVAKIVESKEEESNGK